MSFLLMDADDESRRDDGYALAQTSLLRQRFIGGAVPFYSTL